MTTTVVRIPAIVLPAAVAAAMLFGGCRTADRGGDPALAPANRKAFTVMKYRDPATGTIPTDVREMERRFAARMSGAYGAVKHGDHLQQERWQSRGPWNVGGRTRAFALDATDERTLVAGGISGGMWRSTDGGLAWTKTTTPDQIHSVTCVAQDVRPGRTSTWYYGTGEAYGNSAQIAGNGIWKSTDGARSWSPLASTLGSPSLGNTPFSYTWRICTNPAATADEVYVATYRSGIFRSTDGGATWSETLASSSFFSDIVVTPSGVFYAALSGMSTTGGPASKSGIYRSTDGATWTSITPPGMTNTVRRIVLAVAPSDPDIVYAVAETPGTGTRGVFVLRDGVNEQWHSLWRYEYKSGDGTGSGGTWENRSQGIPLFGGLAGDFYSQGGYDLLLDVSPLDPNVVVIGGTNLYRTTDGFATADRLAWIGGYGIPVPGGELYPGWPNHHSDQHGFAFLPSDPTKAYSANDGGIQFTENVLADTVAWTEYDNGYVTSQFYAIAIAEDRQGRSLIAGGMQDNGTWATASTDGRQPWIKRTGGDGAFCAFADSGRSLVASSQLGRIRRLVLDDAGNEVARTRIDPIGASNYLFINPFVLDPADDRILYLPAGNVVWRNTDITQIPMGSEDTTDVNWQAMEGTRIPGANLTAIAASVANPPHRLYYGSATGRIYRVDGAHTGDGIVTDVTTPALPVGGYCSSITVDPRDADRAVVAYSNYGIPSVFATTDGGATWVDISGNLEGPDRSGPAVNTVAIVAKGDSTMVVVGASTGVYYTPQTNGGSTVWVQAAAETVGNVPVDMVLVRQRDGEITVGTHGIGTYSGTIEAPVSPVPVPTLRTPANAARGILPDTVLAWDAVEGAVLYSLEFSPDPTFGTEVERVDGISGTSYRVTGLVQGPRSYSWRVTAFGAGGRSLPSSAFTFSTAVRPPSLLAPAAGATNVAGNPVRLEWERLPEATSYDLQVALTPSFSPLLHASTVIGDTSAAVVLTESNRRHYWRMRSANDDATGVWGNRQSFVTGTITSIADAPPAADVPHLAPNPARDIATLSMPAATDLVRADLIGGDGRLLRRIAIDGAETEIDLRALAAGAYSVRVVDGLRSWTLPLTVVR